MPFFYEKFYKEIFNINQLIIVICLTIFNIFGIENTRVVIFITISVYIVL